MTSPLVLFVAELQRRPGSRRVEQIPVVLDGLAISTAQVDPGAVIDVDVVVESLSSSIVVAGTISAPWTGACRRCLADAHGIAVAEVREIFEVRPTEGETYPLTGDHLDLEPLVRDAVLLSLPLAPLCREGCAGPAPDAVAVVVADSTAPEAAPGADDDDDPAPTADPRWAALDALTFDDPTPG